MLFRSVLSTPVRPGLRFFLDADLSRIGKVRASVDVTGTIVSATFSVRDGGVRGVFERHASDLVNALREAGYQATVSVEARPRGQDPSAADLLSPAPLSYLSIDLKV